MNQAKNPPPEQERYPGEGAGGSGRVAHEREPAHPPEALTTIDEQGRRKWVYPAPVTGWFKRWRRVLGSFLIALYLVLPWLKVGGMQAVLLQIPERRFILFGNIFMPQDIFYLVFLLFGLALALFFFTAVMGRIWCGWMCPQTVYMEEVFRRIEELIEGDHHARRKLDESPWDFNKTWRKGLKHSLFLLVCAVIANTFIAYFVPVEQLLHWIVAPPLNHPVAFTIMLSVLLVFYFDFAWFREQFCAVVCPYARFQAALTDQFTIQVGYDTVRGEPRGKMGTTSGDCINCNRCVAVCPTGIDIRDGFQMECIGCSRCIDACDAIMDRVKRPRGLVRMDSLARLNGQQTHIIRPRVIIYSILLVGAIIALVVGLRQRTQLDLTITRPPGDPYQIISGRMISNSFGMRLYNRNQETTTYHIELGGSDDATLIAPINPVTLGPKEIKMLMIFVQIPVGSLHHAKTPLILKIKRDGLLVTEKPTTFLAPQK
ncbi:MAG: cytochrome c oxidase accessory protein CcoG [Deltaproteobacteria bacterium]|nr:cytochrome c oxidase accessory protein CcoG [Deltaproteobacteria bacterium]